MRFQFQNNEFPSVLCDTALRAVASVLLVGAFLWLISKEQFHLFRYFNGSFYFFRDWKLYLKYYNTNAIQKHLMEAVESLT